MLSHSVVTGGATPVKKPSVVNRGGKWAVGRKTYVDSLEIHWEKGLSVGQQFAVNPLEMTAGYFSKPPFRGLVDRLQTTDVAFCRENDVTCTLS